MASVLTLESDIGIIGRDIAKGLRVKKSIISAAVNMPQVKDRLTKNFKERHLN